MRLNIGTKTAWAWEFLIKKTIINMINYKEVSIVEAWQIFEEHCYLYLTRQYSESGTKFIKLGSNDSTLPDIEVHPANKAPFFMEAKASNAQCGQFVLIPDKSSETFSYSTHNKSDLNEYSAAIIEHMDKNYESFIAAGTKGQQIRLPKQIFYYWIMNYYLSKNVKYFITKGSSFIIFPIEKFNSYFNVSATYRMKKSGSTNPSKANQTEVIQLLSKDSFSFSTYSKGKAFYISTTTNINNLKIIGNKYTYMFKESDRNIYQVRQLSNTCNSNVIFSISLKQQQNPVDLRNFQAAIR